MATDEGSRHLAALLERIEAKTAVIGVMGMGYVGLPLAATFHRAGFQVMGFDTNPEVIKALEEVFSLSLTHSLTLTRSLIHTYTHTHTHTHTHTNRAKATSSTCTRPMRSSDTLPTVTPSQQRRTWRC